MSASTVSTPPVSLLPGAFIRVRRDHENPFRAGRDAMVARDLGNGSYALVFGYDRHNEPQGCVCVGTELWLADELDWESVAP